MVPSSEHLVKSCVPVSSQHHHVGLLAQPCTGHLDDLPTMWKGPCLWLLSRSAPFSPCPAPRDQRAGHVWPLYMRVLTGTFRRRHLSWMEAWPSGCQDSRKGAALTSLVVSLGVRVWQRVTSKGEKLGWKWDLVENHKWLGEGWASREPAEGSQPSGSKGKAAHPSACPPSVVKKPECPQPLTGQNEFVIWAVHHSPLPPHLLS